MWPFDKKDENTMQNEIENKNSKESVPIVERPRICCIDIEKDVQEALSQQGFNIYSGTLGNKISVPNNRRNEKHQVLLDYNLPTNLHEFDLVIIDLNSCKTVDYLPKDHVRKEHTGKSAISLLCTYPETIFDPKPIVSAILGHEISKMGNKPRIIIAFAVENYSVEYESVKICEEFAERQPVFSHGLYSFAKNCPLSEPKQGKDMTVCEIREDLKRLLTTLIPAASYSQTFHHPSSWVTGKEVPQPEWVPLIKTPNNEIVAISHCRENSITFFLPQFENKKSFLSEFLCKIAPEILPELFPFSTTFTWTDHKEYWLPGHKELIEKRDTIECDYKKKVIEVDSEIASNKKTYCFLHEILTETGNDLTNALIKYFEWLGFEEVIDFDKKETDSNIKEEDIQLPLDNGLMIIECKGIGGTSTDADCSQISKIKHRRCKERSRFDVFALYIVNHQRYLPPLNRKNPPFSTNQINDAINDERGLVTTWQLYNLFFNIENGVVSKPEARQAILKYGLIDFRPKNLIFIYEPDEVLKNGSVCIISIDGIQLKIGDEIIVEKNEEFQLVTLDGIQIDNKPVDSVSSGEVGLLFNCPISKKSKLWKKNNS